MHWIISTLEAEQGDDNSRETARKTRLLSIFSNLVAPNRPCFSRLCKQYSYSGFWQDNIISCFWSVAIFLLNFYHFSLKILLLASVCNRWGLTISLPNFSYSANTVIFIFLVNFWWRVCTELLKDETPRHSVFLHIPSLEKTVYISRNFVTFFSLFT